MRLTHLLKNRVIISRMTNVTGYRQTYTTVTAEMGMIQPMGRKKSGIVDGVFGKQFIIYVEGDTDIQAGDRLKDENSKYYTVVAGGVSDRTYGSFDFKQIVIELTD